jgi:hypothetical protein
MATTTNYGWTTPDDTALVKDGAAAIRTLGSSVDTTTKNLNPSTTLGDIEYRSSTANTNTRLAIGSTGQVLTVAGGVPSWGSAPGATYAIFRDEKSSGTGGGTFTSGAWRTRDLNTSQYNGITGASLASNQISLAAGTYMVDGFAQGVLTSIHQTRFQNITDSTTAVIGQNAYAEGSSNVANYSRVSGVFTIAAQKTFEFQHRATTTKTDNGFGVASSWGTEVYASITITKVA